jgi:hypothetical protein
MIKSSLLLAVCLLTVSAHLLSHQQSEATFICCPDTYVFDDDTLACICPHETPHVHVSGRCVACNATENWSDLTKSCEVCSGGSVWDKVKQSCECPSATPLLTADGSCVACEAPKFWNCKSKKCMSCPNNLEFSASLRRCACPASLPYFTFNNTCLACPDGHWDSYNRKCVTCSPGQTFDANTVECVCPPAKPYLALNQTCVACPAPRHWNAETRQCEVICTYPEHYDPTVDKCATCPATFVFDSVLLKCKCPASSPSLDANGKCAPCVSPKYWIAAKKDCESCVGEQIYSSSS